MKEAHVQSSGCTIPKSKASINATLEEMRAKIGRLLEFSCCYPEENEDFMYKMISKIVFVLC
jgi:hypothetical protein